MSDQHTLAKIEERLVVDMLDGIDLFGPSFIRELERAPMIWSNYFGPEPTWAPRRDPIVYVGSEADLPADDEHVICSSWNLRPPLILTHVVETESRCDCDDCCCDHDGGPLAAARFPTPREAWWQRFLGRLTEQRFVYDWATGPRPRKEPPGGHRDHLHYAGVRTSVSWDDW